MSYRLRAGLRLREESELPFSRVFEGRAPFAIPAVEDEHGIGRRTPQEVLHIVYLTDKEGVSQGGFYPNGMNGALRTT